MPISNGNISNGGSGGDGGDGGATSLTVVSPNGSIVETAQSTYNGTTRKITAYLQAVGSGGSVADYTKYNYPITCDNTPTFDAGEEFILCTSAPRGNLEYDLWFNSRAQAGASNYNAVNIKFILSFDNSAGGYDRGSIRIIALSAAGAARDLLPQNLLNSLFSFKAYSLASPVTINGVTLTTGSVIYTIVLNSTLPGVNTNNVLTGTVASTNILDYAVGVNPNNAALLGVTNGVLTSVSLDETGLQVSSSITPLISTYTNVANMTNNNLPMWANGVFVDSGISYLTTVKKYTKYFFVDPNNGVDANTTANNGSMNAPFKTVAYALTIAPTGTSIVLLGKTTEAALTITKANMDIMTFGTRSALAGFTNKVTINNTVAGSSIRFTGLSFDGGLDIASTNTGGVYVYNGQIGATGFNKNNATGYCEFVGVDASNGVNNIKGGTLSVAGGKLIAPIITGTGTQVYIDNAGSIIGNTTVATGCYLFIYEQNWIAGTTGFAVSAVAGSYVFIENTNFVRPDGSLATVSILGYRSGSNWNYNTTGSALSADSLVVSAIDFFDRIGFSKAPSTITTATKMLVRNPTTNEISEQLIPTATVIPVQFNVPAGTLYTSTTAPQAIPLKSSSGSTQSTQLAQVCNSNGLITLDQIFSASIAPGQTLTFRGQITVYNQVAITTSNYYVVVQPVGVMADSGVWVNLVDSTNVTLSQNAYAYNKVPFSGTFTNNTSTPLDAIGVRMQIIYGVANATAIIDTLFIEGSIS